MTVFCGIGWTETHHDIVLVNEAGELLAKRWISDDVAGCKQPLDLLVSILRTGLRRLFAINLLAAAR
jgi:hypothetical protein